MRPAIAMSHVCTSNPLLNQTSLIQLTMSVIYWQIILREKVISQTLMCTKLHLRYQSKRLQFVLIKQSMEQLITSPFMIIANH